MHKFELHDSSCGCYPIDLHGIELDNWQIESKQPMIIVEKEVNFTNACYAAISNKIVYRIINNGVELYLKHIPWALGDNDQVVLSHFTTFLNGKETELGIDTCDIESTWIIKKLVENN